MIPQKMLKPINFFLDFCIVSCICILFYFGLKVSVKDIVLIPKGSTKSIIAYLNGEKIDINGLDYVLIRFFGIPQSGWIALGEEPLRKADLLYQITKGKAALKEIKLIPGETTYFFFQQIAQTFNLSEEELWSVYSSQVRCEEGQFVPQTYKLPYGADAKEIIGYLLSYSKTQYTKVAKELGVTFGAQQWERLLAKASIIQKEAANVEEMPIVSAVIENRIKKGMPLQMDGSLNYGRFSHLKVTPQRIKEDLTPFNTYKYKGIPNCPSGSVSLEAIKAARYPADVPYLYFVRNKNGTHSFSTNYKEHIQNFTK